MLATPCLACSGPSGLPGVRNAHGLAFDGRLTVLFGGADERQVRGDTWGWDGERWHELAVGGPVPRTFPVMVGDGQAAVYLFGGRRVLFGAALDVAQLLDDLWQWNGRTWTRFGAKGPSPRAEAAGAWDPQRRRLVVFGGYTIDAGAIRPLGDTWEFGDGRWTRFDVPGPAPRHGATAAFDPQSREVVLFGGNGVRSDTWRWNGQRWHQDADAPRGMYNAASGLSAATGPVLRFGGWTGNGRSSETWAWREGRWFPRAGPDPPARNHAAMAFDAVRARLVLVGGHDGEHVFGDVWEHDARRWVLARPGTPVLRVANGH